jgi:DNA-binding response OmpR family regulator
VKSSKMAAKILIVDDQPELTQFLADVLIEEGYQTAVANDAQSGLLQA